MYIVTTKKKQNDFNIVLLRFAKKYIKTTYFKTILKSTAVVRMTKFENKTAMAWEQREG